MLVVVVGVDGGDDCNRGDVGGGDAAVVMAGVVVAMVTVVSVGVVVLMTVMTMILEVVMKVMEVMVEVIIVISVGIDGCSDDGVGVFHIYAKRQSNHHLITTNNRLSLDIIYIHSKGLARNRYLCIKSLTLQLMLPLNPYSTGIDFSRQNLTSVDVRF